VKRLLMRLRRKEGITCAEVHELVQAHLDGELPDGPRRDLLVAHLHRCRPCGVEAETYQRIKDALAAPAPAAAVARLEAFAAAIPGSAPPSTDEPSDPHGSEADR
jgi:hypothetical protein